MADRRENEFIPLIETNDRVQTAMLKGLLEDAGIPFLVDGEIATLVQSVDGLLRKSLLIRVPRQHEAQARELVRLFMQPVLPPESD
jgi:hypothetical protein